MTWNDFFQMVIAISNVLLVYLASRQHKDRRK